MNLILELELFKKKLTRYQVSVSYYFKNDADFKNDNTYVMAGNIFYFGVLSEVWIFSDLHIIWLCLL